MKIKKYVFVLSLSIAQVVSGEPLSEAELLLLSPIGQEVLSNTSQPVSKDSIIQSARAVQMPDFDCLLTPSLDVMIASPVVGVIREILVKKGELVQREDVLVQLHAEVEEATLVLNQAQAKYGNRTIARNQKLYRNKLISAQERDEIVINNRLYSYEMQQTQALLEQKQIRSPVQGVVVDIMLDPGEYVGEEPILNVVQLDPLYVEGVIPARYYGAITNGDNVSVMLESPWNSVHSAKVQIVDQVLDAASATFGVRVELANPNYLLPAGLKCNIRFSAQG